MATPIQMLKVAVEFANFDLDGARKGDILNWKEDIMGLVKVPGMAPDFPIAVRVYEGEKLRDEWMSDGELRETHKATRDFFAQFRSGSEKEEPVPFRFSGRAFPASNKGTPRAVGLVQTQSFKDAFLALVWHLVVFSRTGDVRTCKLCSNLYVRERRQDYCSRKCQTLASSRAYRLRSKKK
ncbi:MAG: hypothetical protein E2P02_02640 [Acidobacteria bacterium]|nr:MAG: hypothetical protein E2P02_02640 [Acidobacteriota bacterium]